MREGFRHFEEPFPTEIGASRSNLTWFAWVKIRNFEKLAITGHQKSLSGKSKSSHRDLALSLT